MNTRKHPRTLNEAFGPYCGHQISEPVEPWDWQDKVVLAGSIITVIICAALAVLGVIV